MTDRLPRTDDELLSAYFDGEVTAEERARAQVLHNTSPTVAAELESYADLSQMLKSLPRETAPSEIAAAVMQRAERATLLSPVAAVQSRRWRSLREVGIFLAGATVAAAGIVLSLQVWPTPWDRRAEHALVTGAKTPLVDAYALSKEQEQESVREFSDVSLSRTDGMALDAVVHRSDFMRFGAARNMALGEQETALAASAIDNKSSGNSLQALSDKNESLHQTGTTTAIPLSEVVPLFAYESEGRIANVEVYSTNPERSVDEFQKILNSNGVHIADEQQNNLNRKVATAGKPATAPAEPDGQLPAVYVESLTEPLTRTLEQLSLQPELKGVKLRPSLTLPLDGERAEGLTESRSRRLDVRQLRLLYEQSNYDVDMDQLQIADLDAPVSAVDALQDKLNAEAAPQNFAQREAKQRMGLPLSGSGANQKSLRSRGVQQQEAIAPLAVPTSNVQQRFNVPVANTANPRGYGNNYYYQTNINPQTDANRASGDEALLRQRMSNFSANLNSVRMLIVFQEAAPTNRPATNPANPADATPNSTSRPLNRGTPLAPQPASRPNR